MLGESAAAAELRVRVEPAVDDNLGLNHRVDGLQQPLLVSGALEPQLEVRVTAAALSIRSSTKLVVLSCFGQACLICLTLPPP